MNLLERIPKLCAALRDAGLAVSVREEVAVRDVLLALAASGESPKTAEDLRDALRPVLCRSQDQLRTYEDTFAEVFPNAVVAVGRGGGFASFRPPKLRRWQLSTVALWGWVIGVAVVLLIFGLDLWVWKNVFGPVLVSTHAEAPAAEPPNLLEPAPNIEVPLPVPIKPTEPAPVSAKSDNRWWIPYTLAKVCGLLSFLLPLLILRARNKHRYLNRRLLDAVEDAEDDVIFQVPIRSPFPDGVIRGCALELRKHRDIDLLDHLDVPATVRASVRRGGWFTPVGRRFKRTPEYLILIQQLSGADHRGRLARYLAAQLRAEGVPVNVWTFRHEPDILYPENDDGTGDALTLEQLHVRMPDHRLLIFSERSVGSDRSDGSAHLALWEQGGAWFADRHPDLAALPGALLAAPAGAEGLAAYTALLRGERVSLRAVAPGQGRGGREELPVLLITDRERWTDVRPPSAGTVAAGLQVLEEYLGAGGLFWLRACAAYPELDWNLTVALGRELDARIAKSAPPDLLNRLIALPWFQEGAMPQWLRRALLRPLRGPERKEIDRALNRILVEGAAEATGDPAVRTEVHQLIAKNPSLIDRLARKLKRREPGAGWKERTVVETFGGDGAVPIPLPLPGPDKDQVRVPRWAVAVLALGMVGAGGWWTLRERSDSPVEPVQMTSRNFFGSRVLLTDKFVSGVAGAPADRVKVTREEFLTQNRDLLVAAITEVNQLSQVRFTGAAGKSFIPLTVTDAICLIGADIGLEGGFVDPKHLHTDGQTGLLPLPVTLPYWTGNDAPGEHTMLSPEQNVSEFLLYLAAIKNKVLGQTFAWGELYTDLFRHSSTTDDELAQMHLLAAVVDGRFIPQLYRDVPDLAEIASKTAVEYEDQEPILNLLQTSGFKNAPVMRNRLQMLNSLVAIANPGLSTEVEITSPPIPPTISGEPDILPLPPPPPVSPRIFIPPPSSVLPLRSDLTIPQSITKNQELATKNQSQTTVSREKPFTNTLGMKFVPVPGTKALFCIWETRVQDYAAFAEDNPKIDMEWKDYEYKGNKQGPEHPVVNVSWEDSQAFCKWLSAKEGLKYRLPTDREWSVAVGLEKEPIGGTPNEKNGKIPDVYPWGSGFPLPSGAGNYSGQESGFGYGKIDGYADKHPFTAPVGSYTANKFGLYDLGGNVWEWCEDYYDGKSGRRVLRGVSWNTIVSTSLLSSYRSLSAAAYSGYDVGFRCVVGVGAGER
jgi:hypothetical protein